MKKTILLENLEYFENEIMPYIIVLHTSEGAIVIKSIEQNYMHLIGAQHSPLIQNLPKAKVFNKKIKNKEYDLFTLISENNYNNNQLTIDERNICNKNLFFQFILNSVKESKVNLFVYVKKTGLNNDNFDCDYIHFIYKDNCGLYLGITGDDKSDYHFFSSIIVEGDNPLKYRPDRKLKMSKVEIINTEKFDESKYTFVKSKHNNKINTNVIV